MNEWFDIDGPGWHEVYPGLVICSASASDGATNYKAVHVTDGPKGPPVGLPDEFGRRMAEVLDDACTHRPEAVCTRCCCKACMTLPCECAGADGETT